MFRLLVAALLLASDASVESLSWMSGCWSMQAGAVMIEESWSRPAGGTLFGWSRVIKGDRTVQHEFLHIGVREGTLTYTARVGEKATATPFRMSKLADGEIVFENPEHDFPQRIIYRKSAEGLFARIEGNEKGKQRAQEFSYRRTACP
jgi:hypothetical protein